MKNYLFILSYFNCQWEVEFTSEDRNNKNSENLHKGETLEDLKDFMLEKILLNKDKNTNFYVLLNSDKIRYLKKTKKEILTFNENLTIFKVENKKNGIKFIKTWLINKKFYEQILNFMVELNIKKKNLYLASMYFEHKQNEYENCLEIYLFNSTLMLVYYDEEIVKIIKTLRLDTTEVDGLKEKILPSTNTIKYNPLYFNYLDQITNKINIFLRMMKDKKINKIVINNYNNIILRDFNYLIEDIDHEKIEFI